MPRTEKHKFLAQFFGRDDLDSEASNRNKCGFFSQIIVQIVFKWGHLIAITHKIMTNE